MSESHSYLVALGSNMRHPRFGFPRSVIGQALEFIAFTGSKVRVVSPIIRSRPIGPSQREFANAAAIIETPLTPHAMLELLLSVERLLGRRRQGQRWRARVIDLDLILWNGGPIESAGLILPHPRFRRRDFVLGPASAIAGDWRDPVTGLSCAHLFARLTRPRPVTR